MQTAGVLDTAETLYRLEPGLRTQSEEKVLIFGVQKLQFAEKLGFEFEGLAIQFSDKQAKNFPTVNEHSPLERFAESEQYQFAESVVDQRLLPFPMGRGAIVQEIGSEADQTQKSANF